MKKILLATVLLGMSGVASAMPMIFFGEDLSPAGVVPAGGNAETAKNSFLSNLSGGIGTEDFEGFGLGDIGAGLALTFPGSTGNIGATLTADSAEIRTGPETFNTSPGGANHLGVSTGESFNIAFDSAIAAFGFYGTDIGDFGGQIILTLSGGGSEVLNVGNTIGSNGSTNGSLLFYGFIDVSNTYTNIAFGNTSVNDFFGFDDMIIGDANQIMLVPEPSIIALFGLGLFGIGFARRRKHI